MINIKQATAVGQRHSWVTQHLAHCACGQAEIRRLPGQVPKFFQRAPFGAAPYHAQCRAMPTSGTQTGAMRPNSAAATVRMMEPIARSTANPVRHSQTFTLFERPIGWMRRNLNISPQAPITACRSGVTIPASMVMSNMNRCAADRCRARGTALADRLALLSIRCRLCSAT